jgi:hypothetical protein
MSMTPLPYRSPAPNHNDVDHIKLIMVFSYIWGGLVAFFSLFGLIYVFMGLMFVQGGSTMFPTTGPSGGPGAPPPAFGWIFIVMGVLFVLFFLTVGGLNLYSARCMQHRKHRVFSLVIAGINCMSFPLGTVLGVFTFMVLLRESVSRMYQYFAEQQRTGHDH